MFASRGADLGVEVRQRPPLAVLPEHDLGRLVGALAGRGGARAVRADRESRRVSRPERELAARELLVGAVEREPAGERAGAAVARDPEGVLVGELDPRRMQLRRNRPAAEDVDRAGKRAAVGREALDERDLPTRRDPRRLQLPLRRVDALDRERVEVDQADPRVVPGALRRLVGADRDGLPAGPADLEHVDPARA